MIIDKFLELYGTAIGEHPAFVAPSICQVSSRNQPLGVVVLAKLVPQTY